MMSTVDPWYLYVLLCQDGSLYTGIARNVKQRFDEHLKGKGARYTRSHPPLKIVAVRGYPDRSSASKAEFSLKRYTRAAKQAFIDDSQATLILRPPKSRSRKTLKPLPVSTTMP